ncbi:acid protease [Neofusicoccum parvum]|uniref:Acid protease n=1 Tax=Neofusicoccum parvum TaxID=310453 RepID=A0ACB5S2C6_9PEZI|nr:acid protease [Neofusicoccum parvum]
MDGNFILGGYDAAKVSGKPYNYSISEEASSKCDYMVTIQDILLDFPNGTTSSIFDGVQSQLLQACIDTSFPTLMTLPYEPYFANFENLSGMACNNRSFGVNYYGILCDATDQLYAGDLTIKMLSGLEVKITNDQLLVPNTYINDNGALVEDNSVKELIINSIQDVNSKDLPNLGRQFLSAAYMMANLDAKTFSLWAANPTDDELIVAINENEDRTDRHPVTP